MLILSINLLLYLGGVRVINEDSNNFLNRFVDIDQYDANGVVVIQDQFKNTVPTSYGESGDTTSILSFIDTLGAVGDFATFIVNIVFTPIGLFMGAGLPAEAGLLLGLPLIMGLVFGIIYFIRSGN